MSETPFQAPSPEHLAGLLPQFDIEFFIAQGGMGAVYKGRQLSLDRDVAVKVLPKEMGANEEFRESFNTEAKAMAKLNHPNLLGVFDFGTVDGMPYIVMEYVEGGSLYEACFDQAVDPKQAVAIVKGICDGLANAHSHDIVHRDIKPANILLTEKIEAKVADFGLAQALDSDQPGLVMGTPGYTAPEVFQDPDQAGKLADIYSVGVILHQLLTGIDPSGSMEPPTKPTGNLRLDAIWRKATNPVPTQRYPTVDAMAKDLEKWASAFKPQAAAGAAAPYRPPSRPVKVSSGGGAGFKILLIAALAVVVVVTYQVLQKQKGEIKNINAETKSNPEVKVVNIEKNPGEEMAEKPDSPDLAANDPDPIETLSPVSPDPVPDTPGIDDTDPEDEDTVAETELEPGDMELRKKAVELILNARGKRDAELVENARWFGFQLGVHGRDAEFEDKRAIEELSENTTETRIPAASPYSIPFAVKADFKRADGKQTAIENDYESSLKQIREAYVKRLADAAEGATEEKLKKQLLAQAERAEELDAWVKLLAPGDAHAATKKTVDIGIGDATEPVELGAPGTWLGKATVLAWTREPKDYIRFRDDVLKQAQDTENTRLANFAAKTACIRPIDDNGVRNKVLKLAELAFEEGKGEDEGTRSFRAMLLGMAQYRCGEFSEALATLESVDLEWPPVALATNYYEVLCMVREGGDANLSKARALFSESEDAMPPVPSDDEIATHAPDRLLLWLAYKEAKVLLANSDGGNAATGNAEFEGKWHNPLSDNRGDYIAHPDGRFEVVGQNWEVTWKILEDGTLELHWPGKGASLLTKDKATGHWIGETHRGEKTMLQPGDF